MASKLNVIQFFFIFVGIVLTKDSWPQYRVATVLHEPWVMQNGTGYTGFIVDLLEELSTLSKFQYKLQLTSVRQGSVDYVHGHYESVIDDVEKKVADLGAADLMVTEERLKKVAFSRPFISTGAQILIKKPVFEKRRTFVTILLPFNIEVWVILAVCMLLIGTLMYIMARVTAKSINDQTTLSLMTNILVYMCGTPCLRGSQRLSRSISCHILTAFWRIFAVLVLMSYLANLTSLFVHTGNSKPVIPFKTFAQLASQSDITYGGWFGMPLNPNDNVQLTMDRFISSRFSYYTDINEAVSRVRKHDYSFAAILSGTEGEHLSNKFCDVMLLREQLFPIDYSFVCRQGEQDERLCGKISMSILTLKDNGIIHNLMQKWWTSQSGCPVAREDDFKTDKALNSGDKFEPLTPKDLGLVFAFLTFGVLLSLCAMIMEFYRHKKGNRQTDKTGQQEDQVKTQERPVLVIDTGVNQSANDFGESTEDTKDENYGNIAQEARI